MWWASQKGSPLECAHKAHRFAVQLQCKRERERDERKEREKNESVVFLFAIQRDLDEVPTFACNNFATDKLNCITTVAVVADELVNVVPLAQLLPSSLPFPSLLFSSLPFFLFFALLFFFAFVFYLVSSTTLLLLLVMMMMMMMILQVSIKSLFVAIVSWVVPMSLFVGL